MISTVLKFVIYDDCWNQAFAHIDKIMQLVVEDLPHEHFVVNYSNVESLAANVKGKCDTEVLTKAIWDDKECPEFTPSHALMVWLSVSGIKSIYLFPKQSFFMSTCHLKG
jgi:hypothetical protein